MFIKITDSYGITLMEWNHDQDHIHLLFRAKPNTDLSRMLNVYKAASLKRIKNEFPEIRKSLWKEYKLVKNENFQSFRWENFIWAINYASDIYNNIDATDENISSEIFTLDYTFEEKIEYKQLFIMYNKKLSGTRGL